ncbi:MAG: hypothetical protein WCP32_01195 [Bacteroidota bacterium]
MLKSNRRERFLTLKEQFPFFVFEKQEYSLGSRGLEIRFTFNLADQYKFYPTLFIPRKSCFLSDENIANRLPNIVFNIGMIELISYWKAACPPNLIIQPFGLFPEQIAWWKHLYFHGLGEFFYLNSIPSDQDTFLNIEVASKNHLPPQRYSLDNSIIIPVGGGKDSAVTLELLGMTPGALPLILNPRKACIKSMVAAGFAGNDYFEIHRTIDPLLLSLNDMGFLNGHTPFSALLGFLTVLASAMTGKKHIALSNESSANEPTIPGTDINHQYSKSFAFETNFRQYISTWINSEINYFSFLRPLHELQIAALFSGFPKYHPVFKSCNAGSKTDSWCCNCPKCLFTYIILAPFLPETSLKAIFGKNLLSTESLLPWFEQLSGLAEEKPFDCIGTVDEVNVALCEIIGRNSLDSLPFLLDYYRNSRLYPQCLPGNFEKTLLAFSPHHHLPHEFEQILKKAING